MFKTFPKFDSVTAEHIRGIQIDEIHKPHNFGRNMYNEILKIFGYNIKQNIKGRVNMAKY